MAIPALVLCVYTRDVDAPIEGALFGVRRIVFNRAAEGSERPLRLAHQVANAESNIRMACIDGVRFSEDWACSHGGGGQHQNAEFLTGVSRCSFLRECYCGILVMHR
jgi:hypothetical protein